MFNPSDATWEYVILDGAPAWRNRQTGQFTRVDPTTSAPLQINVPPRTEPKPPPVPKFDPPPVSAPRGTVSACSNANMPMGFQTSEPVIGQGTVNGRPVFVFAYNANGSIRRFSYKSDFGLNGLYGLDALGACKNVQVHEMAAGAARTSTLAFGVAAVSLLAVTAVLLWRR